MENTKSKFIDMALFGGNLFLRHKEDRFNTLSMFLVIMTFANLHWFSSARFKDYITLQKLDRDFFKLILFKICFFWIMYCGVTVFRDTKRALFKILWLEVTTNNQATYITIKQFKNLILAACHLYFKATGRNDFEYTLANKLISIMISTLTLILKLSIMFYHPDLLIMYVGPRSSSSIRCFSMFILTTWKWWDCMTSLWWKTIWKSSNKVTRIKDFEEGNEEAECAVCMGEVMEGKILNCNHIFHEQCLRYFRFIKHLGVQKQ